MSTLEVNTITPQSGTTLTLGGSGDTINLGSGASGLATTNGITVADQYQLTANITGTNADITANLSQNADASFTNIGTGMSVNSGIFTFPVTGIYYVTVHASFQGASENSMEVTALFTQDNSTYDTILSVQDGQRNSTGTVSGSFGDVIVDVTDTSTHKIKFATQSLSAGNILQGSGSYNLTTFTFIRLGDT
jgi:hypothetical protein